MFIDEVEISVKAGRGGDGVASFRREKYVPRGGPDGGDGGDGGSIYIKSSSNLDTLSYFNARKKFKGEDGQRGMRKKMYGKAGKDLTLEIPTGPIIYETTDGKPEKVIDLETDGQELIIAKGGKCGLGNVHFKSSTNQTQLE